jgi:hypothetical protein
MGKTGPAFRMALEEEISRWSGFVRALFKTREQDYVFPYNRVCYYHYVSSHDVFKGRKYRTQPYKNGDKGNLRDVKLYSLRYLRTSELMNKYHFNWIDWEIYTGMKTRYQTRLNNQIKDPRDYGDWKTYIAKLCTIDS